MCDHHDKVQNHNITLQTFLYKRPTYTCISITAELLHYPNSTIDEFFDYVNLLPSFRCYLGNVRDFPLFAVMVIFGIRFSSYSLWEFDINKTTTEEHSPSDGSTPSP